jgi:hypothetical protein
VERHGLLTVDEQSRVEGPDLAHGSVAPAPADDDRERGEDLLVDAVGVLGREGQLVRAGADADGIEQRVLRDP